MAAGAALLAPATGLLPWVTVGGHPSSAYRVVRDAALLGLLEGWSRAAAIALLVVVPGLGGSTLWLAAIGRRRLGAVAAGAAASLAVAASVLGLAVGDGSGPRAALAVGAVGLGSSVLAWRRTQGGVAGARRTALLAGALVSLSGVAVALALLRPPGANTPDEAMRSVIRAVDRADPIALAEATSPIERTVLLEDGVPLLRRLRSIGLLEVSADLRTIGDRRAALTDVQTAVTRVSPDIASVRIVDARIAPPTRPRDVPVLAWWPRLRAAIDGTAPSFPAGWDRPATALSRTSVTPLVFERRRGHWYLSVVRTLLDASGVAPSVSSGGGVRVRGAGAPSPGDAVEALLDSLGSLDVQGVLRVLDPEELRPVIADRTVVRTLERRARSAAAEYTLVLPGVETQTRRRGATAWVTVRRLGFDLRTTATDAPPFRARYDLDTGCTTVTLDVDVRTRCSVDAWNLFEDLGIPIGRDDVRSLLGGATRERQAFVVVRRSGRWYVSPGRTALRALRVRLEGSDRASARRALRDLRSVVDALR